jgi:hypothetical protein
MLVALKMASIEGTSTYGASSARGNNMDWWKFVLIAASSGFTAVHLVWGLQGSNRPLAIAMTVLAVMCGFICGYEAAKVSIRQSCECNGLECHCVIDQDELIGPGRGGADGGDFPLPGNR